MVKVDTDYIDRVLEDIKEGLSEMEDIVSMPASEFIRSRRARFALRYTIVLIVESAAEFSKGFKQ